MDLIGQNGNDGLHYQTTYGLLDADIVAFKATSSDEKTYDWGDMVTKVNDFDKVKERLDEKIEEYKEVVGVDEMIICLSDDYVNWRKSVHPDYKGQRVNTERPELLYQAKEYLFENYRSYRKDTLEADDVMGILSTNKKILKGKKIIISEDKDMKTIPGYLYNPNNPNLGVVKVSLDEANKFWMYQTLIGDTTDNYKGCKGIGDKKATAILEGLTTVEEMWEAVVETYLSKGMKERDALMNARVARICRTEDYDFKTKEVKLWKPPCVQ